VCGKLMHVALLMSTCVNKPGADGPEVPAGHKLVPDPALAPTHIIRMEAGAEVLAARRAVVERAEQAAVRAATPEGAAGSGKPAAGEEHDVLSAHEYSCPQH
jgi:hypothetical protein